MTIDFKFNISTSVKLKSPCVLDAPVRGGMNYETVEITLRKRELQLCVELHSENVKYSRWPQNGEEIAA
jgi:hypothetical protein